MGKVIGAICFFDDCRTIVDGVILAGVPAVHVARFAD